MSNVYLLGFDWLLMCQSGYHIYCAHHIFVLLGRELWDGLMEWKKTIDIIFDKNSRKDIRTAILRL